MSMLVLCPPPGSELKSVLVARDHGASMPLGVEDKANMRSDGAVRAIVRNLFGDSPRS